MSEDIYFLDAGQVKITAASVGISKKRWIAINENEITNNNYVDLMKSNRFDHLPIISDNDSVFYYFKTDKPNDYTSITKHKINYDDVISLDTNIRDVIDKFTATNRTFYFLTFHRKITGLITIGNLNCKQVQIFIFSLICELEKELGNFLNTNLQETDIKNWVKSKKKSDDPKDKYAQILHNYSQLIESDLENKLIEHFFLVDFFNIICDLMLFEKLEFTKNEWKSLISVNELRKRIAHPTKSLLDNDNNNIYQLKNRLDKINDIIFRLNNLKKH